MLYTRRRIRKYGWLVRLYYMRLARWWRAHDYRYHWKWRAAHVFAAALLLSGAFMPIAQRLLVSNRYELSAEAVQLVGPADQALQKQLTYDAQTRTYQFNQSAVTGYDPAAVLKTQVGTASGRGNDKSLYALDVPTDISRGVTYTDVNSQLSFTLLPQFGALNGRAEQGHLVFPLAGDTQAVYTLKNNGLKEDIVVKKATSDRMTFSYTLRLPKTLAVKVIPNGRGAIGIYGPDPALLGDISYGSSKDQRLVQKARENAAKTNLLFGLPAPVIKDTSGRRVGMARFELHGTTLQVVAEDLDDIHGAFTIDPSVVVTSAGDFESGNNEGMISFNTDGQITRGNLTGGSLMAGTTTVASSPPAIAAVGALGFYNAQTSNVEVPAPSGVTAGSLVVVFLHVTSTAMAGVNVDAASGFALGDNQTGSGSYIAGLRQTGTIYYSLSWFYHYATGSETEYDFPGLNMSGGDGYGYALIITGGPTTGNPFADTFHSAFTNDSSNTVAVPGWTPVGDNNLLLAGVSSFNNISSIPSGWTASSTDSEISYITQTTAAATGDLSFTQFGSGLNYGPIAVDIGTIRAPTGGGGGSGGWTAGPTRTAAGTGFYHGGSAVYNGYMYLVGAFNSGSTNVMYAPINADGSIGSWAYTSSLAVGRVYASAAAYDGYLYAWGGWTSGTSALNDVEYAKINSDGTLGTWVQSANIMAHGVCRQGGFVWNGYLYAIGGTDAIVNNCGNTSTPRDYVQYAPILGNNDVGTWQVSSNVLPASLMITTVAAYNGYVYATGGTADGSWSHDAWYAPILSSGDIGTWQNLNAGVAAGGYRFTLLAYNGYMYWFGIASDSWYAPIYANGQLGTWRTTTVVPGGDQWGMAGAAYNGYIYVTGGSLDQQQSTHQTYYAKISPAGQPAGFGTTGTNFSTARALICSVAYNGYLYAIGGSTVDNTIMNVATVQYATLDATTGQTGTWSAATPLPEAKGSAGCTATNGYLYVLGGYNDTVGQGNSRTDTTYYIAINGDGTLAANWSSGTDLPNAGAGVWSTTYTVGGSTYLYAIGGFANLAQDNTTYYAPLNAATGAIGSWTLSANHIAGTDDNESRGFARVGKHIYSFGDDTASTDVLYTYITSSGDIAAWSTTGSLNTGLSFTNGATVNGCIYAVGGEDSSGTSLATVQYACPNADGSISGWHDAPDLSAATTDMGVTSYGGYIYGVGGYTTSVQTTTQFSYVNNGGSGTLDNWTTSTNSFAGARTKHATVAYKGYLYVIGGVVSGTGPDIQYAKIDRDDGSVGSWSTTTDLPVDAWGLEAVAYNGYLYILGGSNGTNSYNTVYSTAINADGSLGSNWTSLNGFTTARISAFAAAYNGYLYIAGGSGVGTGCLSYECSDVQYATINSDGTIGSWTTTTSFITGRSAMGGVVYDGYMYILGGLSAGGLYLNDVQYAAINSDGSVGTWYYTTSFSGARSYGEAVASNGYLYVAGGIGNSSSHNDVQYTTIGNNGALSDWATTEGFSGARYGQSVAVADGYEYIVGGVTTDYQNDVQYAALNSIARTGHYSKLIDLGAAVNVTGVTYNGMLPGGAEAITYRAAGSSGVFDSAASAADISGTIGCLGTTTNTRYLLVMITLDDSYGQGSGGGFPDSSGEAANLTDLTVDYNPVHPPPNIRLRTGQTLQQGNLSALDTCYP